ncbi:MAG: hypothetical protein QXR19_18085 [Candidatus Jordarchaeaceae archaeon]
MRKLASGLYGNLETLKNEYARIFESLRGIYDDVSRILPNPTSLSNIEDLSYAIEQMANYAKCKGNALII